jgi:hypothetical protein
LKAPRSSPTPGESPTLENRSGTLAVEPYPETGRDSTQVARPRRCSGLGPRVLRLRARPQRRQPRRLRRLRRAPR